MALERLTNAKYEKLDGMILEKTKFQLLFKQRVDDVRLTRGDDTLVATYPRTGQYKAH